MRLYSCSEIKFARRWWRRIELYFESKFVEISETLGKPVGESDLDAAETALATRFERRTGHKPPTRRIPLCLRLLYRFHDGQTLRAQTRMLQQADLDARVFESQAEVRELGLGLFGGLSYYHEFHCVFLLPLRLVVVLNGAGSTDDEDEDEDDEEEGGDEEDEEGRGVSRPTGVQSLYGKADYDELAAAGLSASGGEGFDSLLVFAASTIAPGQLRQGPAKRFYVDPSAARRCGVYTNVKGGCVSPCISPAARARSSAGDSLLFAWLDEFASRLERGVYIPEPLTLSSMEAEGQRAQASRRRNLHFISLFARGDEHTAVSGGVEMSASPALLMHESVADPLPSRFPASAAAEHFFTYGVRLRLLEDHASRPPRLGSCQLVSRHWVIQSDDGRPADRVDGPGVVGNFPLLPADRTLPYPFGYQSCCNASPVGKGTVFAGHLKFRAAQGALWASAPGAGERVKVTDTGGRVLEGDVTFDVPLPTMRLSVHEPLFNFLY